MPGDENLTEAVPTLKDLSNTFVLSSSGVGSNQVLSEIPKALSTDNPFRKRRAHLKSRAGCDNCRRRRVKCDEETPCANCMRRGDHCQRHNSMQRTSTGPIPQMSTQLPSRDSRLTDATVNLLQMKLFHHFHTCTRHTLLCGQEAWDYVLQLSFEYDYLMNAILCVAARHLSIDCPDDRVYRASAANHFYRASSGLRNELSKGSNSIHLDSFLATSMLLYYDTWTNADYSQPLQADGLAPNAWTDRVFEFSSSLKKALLGCFQRPWEQPSVFRQSLTKNPVDELASVLEASSDEVARYGALFSYHRPISMEMLDEPLANVVRAAQINSSSEPDSTYQPQGTLDPAEDAYATVARRLCLILPLLGQDQTQESTPNPLPSSIMSSLPRFILSFPLLGFSTFPTLIERGDSHALFLLYHFYRAVGKLLSHKHWWWAHKRASVAERVLRERLVGKINGNLMDVETTI
ncbi:hypothetical protein GGR55DRAFT_264797 [Xylaria sp. FL0064]|nr:hypothetical protein GGR55DRAFT_264797 [Xylaria sp. FL0064]